MFRVLVRIIGCASALVFATAGCAGVAPLTDATLTEVGLASDAEVTRLEAAKDAYFEQQNPRIRLNVTIVQPAWPTLWVKFHTPDQLFDPLEAGQRFAMVYPCSVRQGQDWDPKRFAWKSILWGDRIVGQEVARQIAEELKSGPAPQEYKVYFEFQNWDFTELRDSGDPITLVPLQEDLCLALRRPNDPFAPSVGEPLRIAKEAVNRAVGDLPRKLEVPTIPPGAARPSSS